MQQQRPSTAINEEIKTVDSWTRAVQTCAVSRVNYILTSSSFLSAFGLHHPALACKVSAKKSKYSLCMGKFCFLSLLLNFFL